MKQNKSYQIHIKVYGDIDDRTASILFCDYMRKCREPNNCVLSTYTINGIKYVIGQREYRKSICIYIYKEKI